MSLKEILIHLNTRIEHETQVFPEDTDDSLTFTAGDANNSFTKDVTDGGDVHDGGDGNPSLIVSTVNFISLGAIVGMTLDNDTNAESTTITAVAIHELTGILSGSESWDDGDNWSFSNVTGWQEILDSAGNKLSDFFTAIGHIEAIDIDQIDTQDVYYVLEIGCGMGGGGETEPEARTRVRFISNTQNVNLQAPKHYEVAGKHFCATDVVYYRMKCETGGATMIGSTSQYID